VIHEKMRYPRKKVREVMAQFPLPEAMEADRMDELGRKCCGKLTLVFV
jgi:hypothetical protein